MPELPEVQTIVNELDKKVAGAVISSVWCDWKKMIMEPKKWEEFEKKIEKKGEKGKMGRRVKRVKRVGKFIIFELDGGLNLVVHLRMTGHFLVIDEKKRSNRKDPIYEKVNNYIHFKLILEDGREIALSDLRKFAKIQMQETKKQSASWRNKETVGIGCANPPAKVGVIDNIGIDPMSEGFILDVFKELLKNKKGNIKQILMDQSVICGIGNIYSSEILWEAKVSPLRKIESLTNGELEEIYKATIRVLRLAIEKRGSSESDYRDTDGKKGEYQNIQRVYQREGEECYRDDGGIIKRTKIGQRSGFWCDKCQK